MEQRGLVERVRDAEDRRVVLARATEIGREAVTEHDGWRDELVEQILEPLDDESLAAIAGRLREIDTTVPDDAAAATAAPARPRGASPT
jgi:DNA-binding MarR family transcriptional regulator